MIGWLRRLLRQVTPRRSDEHVWVGWLPVDEPGISDIEGGRWHRCEVVCARCKEQRRVWHQVDREELARSGGCPGYKCPHTDPSGNQDRMCAKYGCPDDPAWTGDGCV